MKPSGAIGTVAVLLLVALCGVVLAAEERVQAPSEQPLLMLSDLVIEPAAEHEGAYECSATIVDATTGETVSAPRVLFLSGQEGKIRSGFAMPDGTRAGIDILVRANAEDRTAEVRIDLVQDGTPTTLHAVRVSL